MKKTILKYTILSGVFGVSGYYVSSYLQKPVVVEKVVHVVDNTQTSFLEEQLKEKDLLIKKAIENNADKNRRLLNTIIVQSGVGINDDFNKLYANVNALAIGMWQECGICTDFERQYIGYSMIKHANLTRYRSVPKKDKNGKLIYVKVPYYPYEMSIEKALQSYESGGDCKRTYSFMCKAGGWSIPADKVDQYYKEAFSLIYKLEPMSNVINSYVRSNGEHMMHFCNQSVVTANCNWHVNTGKAKNVEPFNLYFKELDENRIYKKYTSLHTFWGFIGAGVGQ